MGIAAMVGSDSDVGAIGEAVVFPEHFRDLPNVRQSSISRIDLVILDEFGYLPFALSGGQLEMGWTPPDGIDVPRWCC
jgi:hypothetical protein